MTVEDSALAEIEYGGSAAAIRHHYDVGNDFYATWLDPNMAYSSAMWDGLAEDAPLEEAQLRKLRYHAEMVGAKPGTRILDVGCGWGSQMRVLREFGARECVGLTLAERQAEYVNGLGLEGVHAEICNWADYRPDAPFDGVTSIGAFEHFAHPDQSAEERRQVYRSFFQSCHDWTGGRGKLSLQTIAYGSMKPDESNHFITGEIFPAAELPTIEDIVVASKDIFQITRLRDDGVDYARTCEAWASKLRHAANRGEVNAERELIDKWYRYLRLSAVGFRMRKIVLLRIRLEPMGWLEGR